MKAIAPVVTPPLVELVDGQPTTTSLDVAEHFGKLHKNVLRAIASLECSPEFHGRNFEPIQIDVDLGMGRTRKDPAFRLTRDGFTFLCMGFTGKEAAKWKEAYINAFNEMELALKNGGQASPKRKPEALPNGLSTDQQGALRALVAGRIEALPEAERGRAATRCWSALKSKFGCGYKEIAPEQFTEAVSLVARLVLEGELLEPEAPKLPGRLDIDYPIEDWKARNPQQFRHDNPNSPDLVVGYGDLLSGGYSPCCDLLDKLHNAGYRIDGAFYELRAYQNLMLQMDMTLRQMVGSVRQVIEGFEQDRRHFQKFVGVKGQRA